MDGSPGQLASFGFFIYCSALAITLERARRNRVLAGCATGLLIAAGWLTSASYPLLHDWVLPPIALLVAYWTSGALFTAPSQTAEARLRALDDAWHIRWLAARAPRLLAEL